MISLYSAVKRSSRSLPSQTPEPQYWNEYEILCQSLRDCGIVLIGYLVAKVQQNPSENLKARSSTSSDDYMKLKLYEADSRLTEFSTQSPLSRRFADQQAKCLQHQDDKDG